MSWITWLPLSEFSSTNLRKKVFLEPLLKARLGLRAARMLQALKPKVLLLLDLLPNSLWFFITLERLPLDGRS